MRPRPPRLARNLARITCRCGGAPAAEGRCLASTASAPTASASSPSASSSSTLDPRNELEQALLELRKHAPAYTNIPRLQLALQGLGQPPGRETVRLAILGLGEGGGARGGANGARDVLRLMLADPLSDTQAWEMDLVDEKDAEKPVIVRATGKGARGRADEDNNTPELVRVESRPSAMLREIRAGAPPVLNGQPVEFLAMRANIAGATTSPATATTAATTPEAAEEAVLVPMVDIPSNTGRFFPIRTPVHRALVFASGFQGAMRVCAVPMTGPTDEGYGAVSAAVDLPGFVPRVARGGGGPLPFVHVDLDLAEQALARFRLGPQHALEYERLWAQSNMAALQSWLKASVLTPPGVTGPAVRKLVRTLLANTLARVAAEETAAEERRKMQATTSSSASSSASSPAAPAHDVSRALEEWAQRAHAELQDQLDAAFTGRQWRMLRWWKLFWRVDDVAALSQDMLAARFLPTAERELVYLAGRIEQARGSAPAYPQPVATTTVGAASTTAPSSPESVKATTTTTAAAAAVAAPTTTTTITPANAPKWPQHISFTRNYLSTSTIPALQALAQRLVAESYSAAAASASVGALAWATWSPYEAGAAAALGLAWAARRMQRRWDDARSFWEGEVREEGRKTLRAAEASVAEVVAQEGGKQGVGGGAGARAREGVEELEDDTRAKVREIVSRARRALRMMR